METHYEYPAVVHIAALVGGLGISAAKQRLSLVQRGLSTNLRWLIREGKLLRLHRVLVQNNSASLHRGNYRGVYAPT